MDNERKQPVQTRTEAETSSPDDTLTTTAAAPVLSSASAQPEAPEGTAVPDTSIPPSAAVSAPRLTNASHTSHTSNTPDGAQAQAEPPAVDGANGAFDGAASAESPAAITDAPAPVAPDAQIYRDLPNPAQPASWHAPLGGLPARPAAPVSPPPGAGFMPPPGMVPLPSHVPWEASSSWGATTLTIQANTAAGASYLFWWVSGMLIYFNERHNRFVRFHAMQSILLTGAMTVFSVLAYILAALCGDMYQATGFAVYRTLGTGIAALAVVLVVIPWFLAMIAAWSGNYMRLPIVGTYAERYSAPPLNPPTVF